MDATIAALEREVLANPGDLVALARLLAALARAGVEASPAIAATVEAAIRAEILAGRYAQAGHLAAHAVRAGLRSVVVTIIESFGSIGRGRRFLDALDAETRAKLFSYARSAGSQLSASVAGMLRGAHTMGRGLLRGGARVVAKSGRFLGRAAVSLGVRVVRFAAPLIARAVAFLGPWGLLAAAVILAAVVVAGIWFATPSRPGVPNCDCMGIHAGILTREWRKVCIREEAALRNLHARGELALEVGPNGTLVAGRFCREMPGPRAWPVYGGPPTPPEGVPESRMCEAPSGLVRACD